MNFSTSRSAKRIKIISFLYQHELLGLPLNVVDAFESGEFDDNEIKVLEHIIKNYYSYKKLIEKHLASNWKWDRLAPLERAALIAGTFELTINDKSQVINEVVNYSKMYMVGDKYKFINSILDKIGDTYEELKKS